MNLAKDNSASALYSDSVTGHIVRTISNTSVKQTTPKDFTPDIFLSEGYSLRKYGINGTIIELPGHTAGSIGILTENEIIVGDAMMNMTTPSPSLIYEDKNIMLKSAKKIINLNSDLIYTGHGKEFTIKQIKNKIK